jgi:hypothetical protein
MSEVIQFHGKRRAPRFYFGGVVELTDLDTGKMKVALVRALSLYGCLVRTDTSFKDSARVALRIAHSGTQFSAIGRVVDCIGDKNSCGIGIEFTKIDPIDRTRLETCLAELAATDKSPATSYTA